MCSAQFSRECESSSSAMRYNRMNMRWFHLATVGSLYVFSPRSTDRIHVPEWSFFSICICRVVEVLICLTTMKKVKSLL